MSRKVLTIGIVCREGRVLLGMKLRGFGAGLWNGPGGKYDETKDKNIFDSFRREALEESVLTVGKMKMIGCIEFRFADRPEELLETYIFRVDSFKGEPQDSEEMSWQWFTPDDIPYEKMWPGDRIWLPQILAGRNIVGKMLYSDKETRNVLEHSLQETEEID